MIAPCGARNRLLPRDGLKYNVNLRMQVPKHYLRVIIHSGVCVFLLGVCLASGQSATRIARRLEFLAEANREAAKVPGGVSKKVLLHNIARLEARAGSVLSAQQAAEQLSQQGEDVNSIYEAIAAAQARMGEVESVKRTIERVRGRRDETYFLVAKELANRGDIKEASAAVSLAVADAFPRRKAQMLSELAALLAKRGEATLATKYFEQATGVAEQVSQGPGGIADVSTELEVARQRAVGGDQVAANRACEGIQRRIAALPDGARKEMYLAHLVETQAAIGEYGAAEATLASINDPMRRAQALVSIVQAKAAKGDASDRVLNQARNIPAVEMQVTALLLVASAQNKAGDKRRAGETLREALKQTDHGSPDWRAWGVMNIAAAQNDIGDTATARTLFKKAMELTALFTIHPDRERPNALRYLARLEADAGDLKGASKIAKMTNDDQLREQIAEVLTTNGEVAKAAKWAREQREPGARASALLGIARGLEDINQ